EVQNNERFQRIHSGEFRLDGEMYDNLSVREKGDTLYYECIHDVKESGLFARLDQMTADEQGRDPAKRKTRDKLSSLLSSRFLVEQSQPVFFRRFTHICFRPFHPAPLFNSSTPESPPPEFA